MADSQQQNSSDLIKSPNINPPIIMPVEEPSSESSEKESDDSNKNLFNENINICSPSTNKLSENFSLPQNKLARSILKPPQLSLNSNSPSKTPFTLNPSRLSSFPKNLFESEQKSQSSINGETPKFVPLIQSETKSSQIVTSTSSKVTSSSNSFVFGQNLQERVLAGENQDEPKPSTSLNSNGTTEMLFSSAIKSDVKTDNNLISKESKSLSESAREYEESRANKRKYEEVEVITGEEEETNILSVSCKLFAFDKTAGSWQERGRGTLRLNDFDGDEGQSHSRLVFRTTGSLRVILNTKIWAEMTVEQASEKSIRFTALDANGEIKVFLVMANIEDSKQLYNHLFPRVQKEIASQKHKKCHTSSTTSDVDGDW